MTHAARFGASGSQCRVFFRWTPHPVIVTIRDNKDYIRVLAYSYYATITGWGVLLRYFGLRDLVACERLGYP